MSLLKRVFVHKTYHRSHRPKTRGTAFRSDVTPVEELATENLWQWEALRAHVDPRDVPAT
jgi:hypothetical protein